MGWMQRLTCLTCAIIFMQLPSFEISYENRMQARLDELGRYIHLFENAAHTMGYPLENYITFFEQQERKECQVQGCIMRTSLNRFHRLKKSYDAISGSTYPQKILIWFIHLDSELTYDTYTHFTPALTLDRSSGIAAILGLLFGALVSAITKIVLSRAWTWTRSLFKKHLN